MLKPVVPPRNVRLIIAFGVIMISAATLLIFGLINRWSVQTYQKSEISRLADISTLTFQNSMETYVYTLYGVRGLMSKDTQVSRADFNLFVSSLALPRRLPGVTAVAYAKLVNNSEKNNYVSDVRNDTQIELAGYPDFSIRPPGERDEYLVLTYVEPSHLSSSREALGFDLLSDDERKVTFETARDMNRAMLTGRVIAAGTGQESFILLLPIFDTGSQVVSVADRQTAVTGLAAMSLQRSQLFANSFQLLLKNNESLRIRVFDGSEPDESKVIYDSNVDKKVLGIDCCQVNTQEIRTFEQVGRTWTIEYTLPQQVTVLTVPFAVMILPLLLIILFSGIGLLVAVKRFRATSI